MSNDELLEILAKSNDLDIVNRNMKKCFDGIAKLIFSESRAVHGLQSPEGEEIKLYKTVSTKNEVEIWLNVV